MWWFGFIGRVKGSSLLLTLARGERRGSHLREIRDVVD